MPTLSAPVAAKVPHQVSLRAMQLLATRHLLTLNKQFHMLLHNRTQHPLAAVAHKASWLPFRMQLRSPIAAVVL